MGDLNKELEESILTLKKGFERLKRDMEEFDSLQVKIKLLILDNQVQNREKIQGLIEVSYSVLCLISFILLMKKRMESMKEMIFDKLTIVPLKQRVAELGELALNYRSISYGLTEMISSLKETIRSKKDEGKGGRIDEVVK